MASTINIQLTDQLRRFVDSRTSDFDVYSTPSEYLRDLIRRDMEQRKRSYDVAVAEILLASTKEKPVAMGKDFFKKQLEKIDGYQNSTTKRAKKKLSS